VVFVFHNPQVLSQKQVHGQLSDQELGNLPRPFHEESGAVIFDKPKNQEEIARETRENEQHEFARAQVSTNKKLAWFTGLLVVGTFSGLAIGIWQASISQRAANAAKDAVDVASRTLAETQTSNARQAELTEKARVSSEESSKQAFQATIDNFHHEQRAWVGPIEMGINEPPIHVGSRLVATIVLTNSGKTPALNVSTLAAIAFWDKRLPVDPHFKIDNTDQPSNSVIQPGMKETITTLPISSPLNSGAGVVGTNDLAEIESGESIVYVFGRITYRDVFQKEHRTTFCGFLNRNLTTLRACKTYNQAD
jgi:hypothetical protein